jgi:hypothetical protein
VRIRCSEPPAARDAFCRLEVKAKDGRGRTVKHALSIDPADFGTLTPAGVAFVAERLAGAGIEIQVARLVSGVRVDYTRATLADLTDGTRLTTDAGLVALPAKKWLRVQPESFGLDDPQADCSAGFPPASAGDRPF